MLLRLFKNIPVYVCLILSFQASAQLDPYGSEFWFGFLNNVTDTPTDTALLVQVQAASNASFIVSIPGQNWSQNYSVSAGNIQDVYIPVALAEITSNMVVEPRAVHIESSGQIAVKIFNIQNSGMDGSFVLPVTALGVDYRTTTWSSATINTDTKSEILIVATIDSTVVSIAPSGPLEGGPLPGSITLNQGDVYRIKGQFSSTDLTGTLIVAAEESGECRPFAVFSGAECAQIPNGCSYCDHIMEQEISLEYWNKTHAIAPPAPGISYTYKIMSNENNVVTIDNGAPFTMSGGQVMEFSGQFAPHIIHAEKGLNVIQFLEGFDCAGSGDPAMTYLPPLEHMVSLASFETPQIAGIDNHYLTVIVRTSAIGETYLDNVLIDPSSFVPIVLDSIYYATIAVSPGNHYLSNTLGMIPLLYGLGNGNNPGTEAYGLSLGFYAQLCRRKPPVRICDAGVVELAAPANMQNFEWYSGPTGDSVIGTDSTYTVLAPHGNISFVVEGNAGTSTCRIKRDFLVYSPETIPVTASSDVTQACLYQQVQLLASVPNEFELYNYSWSPEMTLNDSEVANPVATITAGTTFTVAVTDDIGCSSGSASVYVGAQPGNIVHYGIETSDQGLCAGSADTLRMQTEAMVWSDDFDPSISWGVWQAINNGSASNVCGSVNGYALYFTGTGTRNAVTIPVNVSNGGNITFSLKIANGTAPCDNAEPGDNVVLWYQAGAGAWTVLETFYENAYPEFTTVTVPIPPAAFSNATRFRWQQSGSWAGNQDNWVLDNMFISTATVNNLSFSWQPTVNTIGSSTNTLVAAPTASSWYYVTVVDNVYNCQYHDSVFVEVDQPFSIQMPADTSLCSAEGLQLIPVMSVPGEYQYHWTPNDSTINGVYWPDPVVTPVADQIYVLNAISEHGCAASASTTVHVFADLGLQIQASDDMLCSGDSVVLSATTVGNEPVLFTWIADGFMASDQPTVTWPNPHSGYVQMIARSINSGCVVTDSLELQVHPPFAIQAFPSSVAGCDLLGDTIAVSCTVSGDYSFSWIPEWAVSDAASPITTVSTASSVDLTVIASTPNGCSAQEIIPIQWITETTSLGPDIHACEGDAVVLRTNWTEDYDFLWSNGSQDSTLQIDEPGLYWVKVTGAQGCLSFDTVAVFYHPYPFVDAGPDVIGCQGDRITIGSLANSGPLSWLPTGATTPTTVVELSDEYILKAYNNWCASYDTVSVQLIPKPEQPFGTDSVVCFAYQSAGVKLFAGNDSCTWIWQDGSAGQSYYVTSPGLYEVIITTPGGCAQTYSMNITEYCPGGIYVPNAFSPDGDGINDIWQFKGDRVGDFHVWLYDRWGVLVFESDDINGQWSGESKARPGYVRNQTFSYRIEYNLLDEFDNPGPMKNLFGSLTVVR